MKKISPLFFLIILFTGWKDKPTPICDCCEITYKNIPDALKCISENPRESSYDNRLLLLAFTDSNIDDWNIINDTEIISIAKRNYLLITLPQTESDFLNKNGTPELLNIIKNYRSEDLFFVIVNQAFYPFADWNGSEKKEVIIDRIKIGNGP